MDPVAESAWTRPIASISAVSLAWVDARIEMDRFNRERRKLWRASTVFTFVDGEHFTVPLFPERPAQSPDETETDFRVRAGPYGRLAHLTPLPYAVADWVPLGPGRSPCGTDKGA